MLSIFFVRKWTDKLIWNIFNIFIGLIDFLTFICCFFWFFSVNLYAFYIFCNFLIKTIVTHSSIMLSNRNEFYAWLKSNSSFMILYIVSEIYKWFNSRFLMISTLFLRFNATLIKCHSSQFVLPKTLFCMPKNNWFICVKTLKTSWFFS